MCVACTSQMMWDYCASSAVCMKSKSDVRPNDKSSSHVYVHMYVRVLVCVCLLACVRCCISNYGLRKPIMVVLPCCDAQDHSLHRKYFVIDVCVCVCVCEQQPIRMKGSCGMRGCVRLVCGVCVFATQVGRWLLTSSQRKS